jgi:adenosine deaminase
MESNEKIVEMGTLSRYVLDRRVPLEICLSSNLHTTSMRSLRYHPFPLFYRNKFRVTLNTDNRLMSDTSMTKEFVIAVKEYNFNMNDVEKLTLNAMKSAFISFQERLNLIYNSIKPGFARLRAGVEAATSE